jgi:anti-sigma factor RsiW
MDCIRSRQSIQELVDGTLGPIRRAELEQHLAACDACGQLAEDLQFVRDAAASLDTPMPPARVWMQVAGRLRQEGRVSEPAAPETGRRHMAILAIAAALILAVGASLVVLLRDSGPATPAGLASQAGNAQADGTVQAIADEIQMAVTHYQNVITKLEELAKLDAESGLNPQTAATLQKSLMVIDQAIAESRVGVRADPQNPAARQSLFDALRQKVTVLQSTVVLMNEMRQGNSFGAAQVMDGVNKS